MPLASRDGTADSACPRVPGRPVARDGRGLPIRTELLQLHDRGLEDAWCGEGNAAGALENIALPSVWRTRLRPRSAEGEVAVGHQVNLWRGGFSGAALVPRFRFLV